MSLILTLHLLYYVIVILLALLLLPPPSSDGIFVGRKRFIILLILLSWYLLPYPLLKFYQSNLLNASSSFSHGVNFSLSQELTDVSETEFCSVGVWESFFHWSAHSLDGTDINWTFGKFSGVDSSSSQYHGVELYLFLSLNFKYSNAVLESHCHILFITAVLAIIFGNSLALSILRAKFSSFL